MKDISGGMAMLLFVGSAIAVGFAATKLAGLAAGILAVSAMVFLAALHECKK